MIYELRMPDLTTNDAPVRIVRWIAQPGEVIERGQPLLEAETDKATVEVEAAVSGRLQQALCQAGDDVSVGQVIALIEMSGTPRTPPPAAISSGPSATQDSAPAVAAEAPRTPMCAAQPGAPLGMFARNRAVAEGLSAPRTHSNMSAAQRTMARRTQSSKQTIPHFYLQASCNAEQLVARRQAAPGAIAWDAFFVRAAALALGRFDRFRWRWDGEGLIAAETDAIGVAIDVHYDLFVVAIEGAGAKSVEQLSDEIRSAATRLASGDQEARRLRPALMTVTNLGSCAVERFVPIINPPEPVILGVGKVMLTPAVMPDGRIVAQHRCVLTLCVDHRVASGKYAAEFLAAIVRELEA